MFATVLYAVAVIPVTALPLLKDYFCVRSIKQNSPSVCYPRSVKHFAGEMAFDDWTDFVAAGRFDIHAKPIVDKVRSNTIKDGMPCRRRDTELEVPANVDKVVDIILATVAKLPDELLRRDVSRNECTAAEIDNILTLSREQEAQNRYPHICQVSTHLKKIDFVWRLYRWATRIVNRDSEELKAPGPAHFVLGSSRELLNFFFPHMQICWNMHSAQHNQILDLLTAMRINAVEYKFSYTKIGEVLPKIDNNNNDDNVEAYSRSCLPDQESSCVLNADGEVRNEFLGPPIMRRLSYHFTRLNGVSEEGPFRVTGSEADIKYVLHDLKDDPEDTKEEQEIIISDVRVVTTAMKRFIQGTGIRISFFDYYNAVLRTGEQINDNEFTRPFLQVVSSHESCNLCYLAAMVEFIKICSTIAINHTTTKTPPSNLGITPLANIIEPTDKETPRLSRQAFLEGLLLHFNIEQATSFLQNKLGQN